MLHLYRRHYAPCPHISRRVRNCANKCPIWVQGTLGGQRVKKSLSKAPYGLTSMEAATDLVRAWEAAGEIGGGKTPVSVKEAVDAFLKDLEAQKASHGTRRIYKVFLHSRLVPWCQKKGVLLLKNFGVREVREFRESYDEDSPLYALKNLERLRTFFRFCVSEKWVSENPAKGVKLPQAEPRQRLPFSKDEVDRILKACSKFRGDKDRARAFVLVMLWTGFRLSDAVALRRDSVKDGRIFIRTVKTGTDVWVPVPPVVIDALGKLPKGGEYYFWNGESKLQSRCGDYWRVLRSLFKTAKVKGHSHKFRHTFITRLLDNRMSVEEVGILAGVSPKVLLKHYYHHLKERQDRIERLVEKTFPKAS